MILRVKRFAAATLLGATLTLCACSSAPDTMQTKETPTPQDTVTAPKTPTTTEDSATANTAPTTSGESGATKDSPASGTNPSTEGEDTMIEKISAREAHDMMTSNETVILDVRQPEEYAAGHIVNARLLPLDTITNETATAVAPDKSTPVLVYCRSGVRSAQAAQKLATLGYEHIYDFGGILDWPYDTIITDDETPQSGLSGYQLPVGVKVVCGKTKSLPETD